MEAVRDWVDTTQLFISFIMRGALTAAVVYSALRAHWAMVFTASMALIVSLLPMLFERSKLLYFPIEFELSLTGFVFAALILGEGLEFYDKFWWWDLLLHSFSGLALGFVGFLIVYLISKERGIQLTPIFVALFSFSFSVALATIWEIFEFTMDQTIGTSMQRSGIVDTMWDLIVGAGGALATATIGFFYVKGGDSLLFDRLLGKFIVENRKLFPNLYRNILKIFLR